MNDFIKLVITFENAVLNSEVSAFLINNNLHNSSSKLLLLSSQIESFLKSIDFFKKKLLNQFSGLPDVTLTYVSILNILIILLNYLLYKIVCIRNNLEAFDQYHFPKVFLLHIYYYFLIKFR